MGRYLSTVLKLAIGGAVVFGAAGCSAPSAAHTEAVTAANQRWSDIRMAVNVKAAQQYFDAGDLGQAEATLLEGFSVNPNDARLHLLAGRVALERGQLERAHGRLQRAIELDAKLAEARYCQGIVLQRWQRHEAALDRYRQAYELRADNAAYLLAVGETLVELDRVDEAVELLSGKLVYFERNAVICLALGQLHVMRKEPEQATALFRQAMLLRPDDDAIAEELATALAACGRFDEAVDTLEPLCEKLTVHQRPGLWATLADALRQGGRVTEARAVARRLCDAGPEDADNWTRLGELAWLDQDPDSALAAARRAIAAEPERYEGHMLAGMVWQGRGRTAEALAMFDRAAELAPRSAEPLILRGITLQQAGKLSAAAEAYEQALRRQPGDDRASNLLAAVTADQAASP